MRLTFIDGSIIDTNSVAAVHKSAVKVAESIRKTTIDKLKNEKRHVTFIEELALYMPTQFELDGITWWCPMSSNAGAMRSIHPSSPDTILCYANMLSDPDNRRVSCAAIELGLGEIFTEDDVAEYVEGFILRPHLLYSDLYNYTDTWGRSEIQTAVSEKSYFRSIADMMRVIEYSILPNASTKDIEKLLVRTMINGINQVDTNDIIARICGMVFHHTTLHIRLSSKKTWLNYKLRATVNTKVSSHSDIYDMLADYVYLTPTLTIAANNEDGGEDEYELFLPFIAAGPRALAYDYRGYREFIDDFNNMMSNETIYQFLYGLISRLEKRYEKNLTGYLDLGNYPQIIRPEPKQDTDSTKESASKKRRRSRTTKREKYEFDDMNIEPASEEAADAAESETASD